MNVNTGELRMLEGMTEEELKEFVPVPDQYEAQAKALLEASGGKSAWVDLEGDSPLAEWARAMRVQNVSVKQLPDGQILITYVPQNHGLNRSQRRNKEEPDVKVVKKQGTWAKAKKKQKICQFSIK